MFTHAAVRPDGARSASPVSARDAHRHATPRAGPGPSSARQPRMTPAPGRGILVIMPAGAAPSALASVDVDTAAAAAVAACDARVARLELLIELRRLYRNMLRADRLLAAPSPAFAPSSADATGDVDGELAAAAAVEYVAELQLTEAQLRVSWCCWRVVCGRGGGAA